jgi:nitrous oxidase accessory protein
MRFWLLALPVLLGANPLQEAIDRASSGAKIELNGGTYKGSITINKPLILSGKNGARIVGEGRGSVILISSSDVAITGLSISGSGESHEDQDSAIKVQDAQRVKITHNNITDALFGINLQQVSDSIIEGNYISSKPRDLGLRGDGIVLWYSHHNDISRNTLYRSRDLVAWYSSRNTFMHNRASHGRYSLHFMYSTDNTIAHNDFEHNSVGIFFMFSQNIKAYNNTVKSSVGTFGLGLGLKDCSDFDIHDNNIIYNARGVYFDQTPYQPHSRNLFRDNNILYNSNAMQFQGLRESLIIEGNTFRGNLELVTSDLPKRDIAFTKFSRNYFDAYEGWDKDRDGVGDIPFRHYKYADRLWMYNDNIRFFQGTVAMDLLNFLARLAPFSQPDLLAQDDEPLMRGKL